MTYINRDYGGTPKPLAPSAWWHENNKRLKNKKGVAKRGNSSFHKNNLLGLPLSIRVCVGVNTLIPTAGNAWMNELTNGSCAPTASPRAPKLFICSDPVRSQKSSTNETFRESTIRTFLLTKYCGLSRVGCWRACQNKSGTQRDLHSNFSMVNRNYPLRCSPHDTQSIRGP